MDNLVYLPSPPRPLTRWERASAWVRTALSRLPALRRAPAPLGISSGKVARNAEAESEAGSLARSPTVYGATTWRSLTLATYPLIVGEGYGVGRDFSPIDPAKTPWAASLLRLLSMPDPADWSPDALFPAHPGETSLLAQIFADLLSGNAWIAPILSDSGEVIGLSRLHPARVTLERREGAEVWVYRVPGRPDQVYPRRTVAHLRLLSWQASGAGELGTGPGAPLAPLVAAESEALRQTANVVQQGATDVLITGKSPAANEFLKLKKNREEVAAQASEHLAGGTSGRQRVMVVSGDLDVRDLGLKPADLRAPETLLAARSAELMALGVTPIMAGSDAGTYATAIQQLRVQLLNDQGLCYLIEVALLRPLARHFASRAGGRWATKADRVTCRIDLSGHPGQSYLRSEALARAEVLTRLGWTAAQAAEIEGLELPDPEGTPAAPSPSAAPPGALPEEPGAPRRPLGEPAPRLVSILARSGEEARAALWRAAEDRRAPADRDLQHSAQAVLDAERERYTRRAVEALQAAYQGENALRAAYGPINWASIFGDLASAAEGWFNTLLPDWSTTWRAGRDAALEGTGAQAPSPELADDDLDPLRATAEAAAQNSQDRVREIVQTGIDRGAPIAEIQRELQADQIWAPPRALRVARTETVRAETSGQQARYRAAEAAGLTVLQEWVSARDSATREGHRALDGQRRPPGQPWRFPGGPETTGPGLSGDPGEDINCRCTLIPRVE